MFPNVTPSTNASKRETAFPSLSTPVGQVHSSQELLSHGNQAFASSNNAQPPVAPPSTTARTYKTRERLYYETDYVKSSNSPVNANPNSPNLFEPFLRKQSSGVASSTNEDSEELPPTASLHEYLLNSGTGGTPIAAPSSSCHNPSVPSTLSNLCSGSPMIINGVIGSPMKTSNTLLNLDNSIFVSGGSQQMTRSITVFGFPPNCRNEVLLSFQSHGSIESFDAAPDEASNWIHIVYESEWAAQKALNRNGTIFQPIGIMIGVIPMQTALERVNLAADSFMSPIKKKSIGDYQQNPENFEQVPSIFLKNNKSNPTNTANGHGNIPSVQSLPSESSLVTKAVNYIFGW